MSELLIDARPTIRVGRRRTLHRPRVLIEENRVVIRTACGLKPTDEGFVETFGFITCDECGEEQ